MQTQYNIDKILAKAFELGKKAGENSAGWYEQDAWGGRCTRNEKENAEAFLKAYDEGDPALFDNIKLPDLSGEWSGDLSGPQLFEMLTGLEYGEDPDCDEDFNDICLAWGNGCQEGFFDFLVASANSVLN